MLMGLGITLKAQINESFSDGNFTANPTWSGSGNGDWSISTNSSVGPFGGNSARVLKLNGPNVSGIGVEYLSTQVPGTWGETQTWMFWLGRETAMSGGNSQIVWLYADGANLGAGAGRSGYFVSLGFQSVYRLQLQRADDGIPTVMIQSNTISSSISDFGILVRVTRSPTGVWKLFSSALPTGSGQGHHANTIPSAANTTVDHDADGFTDNTYTYFNNGFMGFRADYDDESADRDAAEFDNFIFSFAGQALPVKLNSFDAAKDGNTIKVFWNASDEINLSNYTVERSVDGINFNILGKINAENLKNYSFTDAQPGSDHNYYRLRIVDVNGSYRLSHIVSVKSKAMLTLKLSPNPVRGTLTVQHPKASAGTYMQILSAEGRMVRQIQVPANAVITPVDMSAFRNGTYYISFTSGKDKFTATVVKQ